MGVYEINAMTTIAVPPQQVWDVLDDFSGWPHWMPLMQSMRVEHMTEGPPRMGYRFRLRGTITFAELQVIGYAPNERATRFRLNLPPLTGENRCIITPIENGHYRILRSDRLHVPGPVALFLNSTQRDRFEKMAIEFVVSLKKATEHRAAEQSSLLAEPHPSPTEQDTNTNDSPTQS